MRHDHPSQGYPTAGGGRGMPGPVFPLPPTFPPDVDPTTYRLETVTHQLRQAAYFPIFSIANPASPNVPIFLWPGLSFLIVAVEVNEQLHRFEATVEPPVHARGLRAISRVGEPVASVHIRWTPIPENFEAAPDRVPPTTVLNPFCSQRFTMLDGHFQFQDRDQSGFKGFGTGRTFPVQEGGKRRLRIGAVIDILEGLGKLKGLVGTVVVNGYIEPPQGLALNLLVRLMDPTRRLKATSALTPLREVTNPDPDAVFMFFLGEVDPEHPVTLNLAPDGRILGSNVYEILRLVHIGFNLHTPIGLCSRTTEGPIVGTVRATLAFNPLDPRPVSPIRTTNGVFTFLDSDQRVIGTVQSNMVEGRALRTELEGAPMPIFRFGGFGPILGGTGQFSGADGMMSMNSAVSVFPRTLSNLYIFRFYDPAHKLHDALRAAWA
jgi:hypothetical protein